MVPLGEKGGSLRFFSEKLNDIEQERGRLTPRVGDLRRIFNEALRGAFDPLPSARLALENFASQRIAIGEKYYRDNDRLLEGDIWAEVVIAHSDMDADDYAFYVEDLRPIQLSRFDFPTYVEARATFSRDEWMDAVLRSVGLEPSKLTKRLKFHFIARLVPLVEAKFNFVELGRAVQENPTSSASSRPTRPWSAAARRPSRSFSTTTLATRSG